MKLIISIFLLCLLFSHWSPAYSENNRRPLSQLDFEGSMRAKKVEPEPTLTRSLDENSETTKSENSNNPHELFLEAQKKLSEAVTKRFNEVESKLGPIDTTKVDKPASSYGKGNKPVGGRTRNTNSIMHREKGKGVPVLKNRPQDVGVPIL